MARGVNKAIVLGNLGKDPEVRYTQDGTCVVSMSIATSESWVDKGSGEKKDRTEWHRVCLFGKGAEFAAEYVHKGDQVYIEGSLVTRKWQDKNGTDHYTTEIVARNIQLLGGKRPAKDEGRSTDAAPFQDDEIPF